MKPMEKMWFGTKDYATWISPPKAGADSSPVGWESNGTYLNGLGYGFNSRNSHKQYNYSWSASSSREEAQLMKSFADGSFGTGKLYFQEPNIYDINVLNARWASPSMTCDYGGPSLVPGVNPKAVNASVSTNRLPVQAAQYDLSDIDHVATTFVPKYTNLFTNPRFTSSGSVEAYRNIALNPSGVSGGGAAIILLANNPSWHARVQGAPVPAPHPQGITTCVSFETLISTPVTFSAYDADGLALTRPDAYIGAWFYSTVSGTRARVALGAEPWTTLPANTWTFVVSSTPVPSTSYAGAFAETINGSNVPIGTKTYVTGVCEIVGVKPTETIAGGLTPTDTDFLVDTWAGTANNSASIRSGRAVSGFEDTFGTVAICSTRFVTNPGEYSVRLIPRSASNNVSYATILIPVAARSSGTVVITNTQEAAITGSVWTNRGIPYVLSPNVYTPTPLPNSAGSITHRIEYASLTSNYALLLPHGGLVGSGDVWYSAPGIFTGSYAGPSFNGSTGTVVVNGEQLTTRWTGAVDNTTSQAGTEEATSLTLDDSNSIFVPLPDGKQISFGAFYSATGSAGVFVSPAGPNGAPQTQVYKLDQLPSNATNLFTTTISKAPGMTGVYLWFGKTTNAAATLTVQAVHARITDAGEPVSGPNYWLGGQGHSGVRFVGKPTYITHNAVHGSQIEFAATFKEVLF